MDGRVGEEEEEEEEAATARPGVLCACVTEWPREVRTRREGGVCSSSAGSHRRNLVEEIDRHGGNCASRDGPAAIYGRASLELLSVLVDLLSLEELELELA